MTRRMLIDARHQEETRVAVLNGNRIEEFDFESADHKQIKGNIYLAKVTRVEPSLQAAFVDFGGNRHGFLAFSEIHPDYYQIPKQDREALLAEEAAHAEEEAALRAAEDFDDEDSGDNGDDSDESADALADELVGEDGVTEVDTSEKDHVATIEDGHVSNNGVDLDGDDHDDAAEEHDGGEQNGDAAGNDGRPQRDRRRGRPQTREADELRAKRMALRRRYKIQDVIQRRQVLLVQVVKEERGNKGAALTTYLSLAGRYCVLMPNSSHGGGISRKISSTSDRKRLKGIIAEMSLPKSMGCIVRTAGLSRTKTEIKRDFDYLARLWDDIREITLRSSAPTLIHSDSDLVKRAIRDIYNRDIEEVIVEGEEGYRSAKEFMKLLMPSHGRRVKHYADPVPLFQRYGAEDQLTAMYDPVVQLKSGGYLVINPTEALVSIDINSGRSTKEHGIEATALNTNLEAAREIARQLRLRDMAGLVVIDFIDMEYGSNVRKVEKAMKDALKNDRARIQVGRISGFGLMEMSRQRLRTGVLEATTRSCPHCDGSGLVRTAGSAGLSALRLIEDEAAKGRGTVITLFASQEAAIYVLNAKRADLAEIEDRYGVRIEVMPEGENEGAKMRVLSSGPRPTIIPRFEPIVIDEDDDLPEEDFAEDEDEVEEDVRETGREGDEREDDERGDGERGDGERGDGERGDDSANRRRRKRRRGRKGRRDEGGEAEESGQGNADVVEAEGSHDEADEVEGDEAAGEGEGVGEGEAENEGSSRRRRRRSRRRRGGFREEGSETDDVSGTDGAGEPAGEASDEVEDLREPVEAGASATETGETQPVDEDADRPASPDAAPAVEPAGEAAVDAASQDSEPAAVTSDEPAAAPPPRRRRRTKAEIAAAAEAGEAVAERPARPRRSRAKAAAEPVEAAEAEPAEVTATAEPVTPAAEETADLSPPGADQRGEVTLAADLAIGETPASEPELPSEAASAPTEASEASASDSPELQSAEPNADQPRRGWWQRTFGA